MEISLMYPNYSTLKILTRWAGSIGIIQSFIWLGLSIVGIVYNNDCVTDFKKVPTNFGAINGIVFQKLYFQCEIVNLDIDFNIFKDDDVKITLNTEQIYIWIWVYLVSSILWAISSASLIFQIKKTHLRRANCLLYIWTFITLYTTGMDLGLSVIFGLDYEKFNRKSMDIVFAQQTDEMNGILLLGAKVASISLMILSAKGFVLLLINIGFSVYFFKETFAISEAILGNRSLVNRDFQSETHSIRNRKTIIKAYDTNNGHSKNNSLKLNTAPIERASRISSAILEDRSYEQYPNPHKEYDSRYPEPDYTPPMSRANPFVVPIRPTGSESFKNKRYL